MGKGEGEGVGEGEGEGEDELTGAESRYNAMRRHVQTTALRELMMLMMHWSGRSNGRSLLFDLTSSLPVA
jgi:hypothetical protein